MTDNEQLDNCNKVAYSSKRVHGKTKAPGSVRKAVKASTNVLVGKGYNYKYSQTLGMLRRVRIQISKRWGIFRPAQDLLLIASLHLTIGEKRTFSAEDLMKFAGISQLQRKRQIRWVERLADDGFLIRVKYNRGKANKHENGYGFAISERGEKVIKAFDEEMIKAEDWYSENKTFRPVESVVLYLDKLDNLLSNFQEALLTEEQKRKISGLSS